MSKYKVGDKLNLQMIVDDIDRDDEVGVWVSLEKDNAIDGMWLTEEQLDKYSAKTYNKGLEDAWKVAQKLNCMSCTERRDCFDLGEDIIEQEYVILNELTPQEALAKLEAYEKEQAEIKVGDVVRIEDSPFEEDNNVYGVVTGIYANHYEILVNNGDGISRPKGVLKKTGKHIDISSILEQIKES